MKKRTGAVVLLLTTFIVAAARGQDPRRIEPLRVEGIGSHVVIVGASVERIMSLRDELKLTEDQLRKLEELRKQRVQREQEMIELRSRAAAGGMDREALQSHMEEQREQMRKNAETARDQIDKILTQEQQDRLSDRTRALRGIVAAPRFERGMRLRDELRMTPRLRREFVPGNGTLNRVAPRLRNFNELSVTPRYYWFGNGPFRAPGVLRRRGML